MQNDYFQQRKTFFEDRENINLSGKLEIKMNENRKNIINQYIFNIKSKTSHSDMKEEKLYQELKSSIYNNFENLGFENRLILIHKIV